MDRRKFITGCACCASIAALAAIQGFRHISRNSSAPKPVHYRKDWIPIVDFMAVTHCNLKCKSCHHFSCIAEEEIYNPADFERDAARLAEITGAKVEDVTLLGGETLLHPQINELMLILRKYFPDSVLDVLTNGILLNSMDDSFWKTARKTDAHVSPSFYNVDIDWKSVFNKAEKFGVKLMYDESNIKMELDNLPYFKEQYFHHLNLDLNGKSDFYFTKPLMRTCHIDVPTMYRGKFYPCFIPGLIHIFNKKFNQNLITNELDYIDIYKTGADEFMQKLADFHPQFCRYCGEIDYSSVPWQNSLEHTMDEWT